MRTLVGIVGSRGMVGQVLVSRMMAEGDFDLFESKFFSTSQVGQDAPNYVSHRKLCNAYNIGVLSECDIIITCQGSDWTNEVYPRLRQSGWTGFFIDASSALRMQEGVLIALDPLNRDLITDAIRAGSKTFTGANCTVSLMLMALQGLIDANLVDAVISDTYQSASGAGAANMLELLDQMGVLANLRNVADAALDADQRIDGVLRSGSVPVDIFGVPLALSLVPQIDVLMTNGQSKEEWKGMTEANKILNRSPMHALQVDGTCARVPVMRCHSQALTVFLKANPPPLDELEHLLSIGNDWVKFVPNDPEQTKHNLTPVSVSGTLDIKVGRMRFSQVSKRGSMLHMFTVGDQLLWGAAEPLRRLLRIVLEQ